MSHPVHMIKDYVRVNTKVRESKGEGIYLFLFGLLAAGFGLFSYQYSQSVLRSLGI